MTKGQSSTPTQFYLSPECHKGVHTKLSISKWLSKKSPCYTGDHLKIHQQEITFGHAVKCFAAVIKNNIGLYVLKWNELQDMLRKTGKLYVCCNPIYFLKIGFIS